MPQGARFRPRQRLRRASDYRRVLRRGMRLTGPLFVMVAVRVEGQTSRLGLTISRRVGQAVVRNRARRLLRESFRRLPIAGEMAFDLVVIPKPEIVGRSQAEVDSEYGQRIRQLLARSEPQARRAGAPPAR